MSSAPLFTHGRSGPLVQLLWHGRWAGGTAATYVPALRGQSFFVLPNGAIYGSRTLRVPVSSLYGIAVGGYPASGAGALTSATLSVSDGATTIATTPYSIALDGSTGTFEVLFSLLASQTALLSAGQSYTWSVQVVQRTAGLVTLIPPSPLAALPPLTEPYA